MVTAWEVFAEMHKRDDQALKLAPLSNITNLQKVKAGTKVTIGVAGDEVSTIYHGKYIGGLILCDKERFEEVKAELESAEVE